jgi:hypothetical protein
MTSKTHCAWRAALAAGLALSTAATLSVAADTGPAMQPGAPLVLSGARATPVGNVPDRVRDAALNALLVNLLDDDDPPRFADPQWAAVCAQHASVLLDGIPVRAGEAVPARSFELDWTLHNACPLGPDGPRLFGRLRMLVVRDDVYGLVPLVIEAR